MTPHAARMEEPHTCETCQDTGRVSNGRSPFDPGYDDGPCPEPDCVEGASERGEPVCSQETADYMNALVRGRRAA